MTGAEIVGPHGAWNDEPRVACACCGNATARDGAPAPCVVCRWANDPQASIASLAEARRRWEADREWAHELVLGGVVGEFLVTGRVGQ